MFFNLFKKKDFFSAEERKLMVDAIGLAEQQTSGEIRVFVESRNYLVNPLERAAEIFYELKMQNTEHRNAVLLYIAIKHKELALFADEGIYTKAGTDYWNNAVRNMLSEFEHDGIAKGVTDCIKKIGETLKEAFPYEAATDKNELPDDIVFGK